MKLRRFHLIELQLHLHLKYLLTSLVRIQVTVGASRVMEVHEMIKERLLAFYFKYLCLFIHVHKGVTM